MQVFSLAFFASFFTLFEDSFQLQLISDFYQFSQVADPDPNKFYFDTTRNKRQRHGIISTVEVYDDMACIHQCFRLPWKCIAVNFKKLPATGRQVCELLEIEGRNDDETSFENNVEFDFILIKNPQFRNCWEIKKKGYVKSGIFHIRPHHFRCFVVFCDLFNGWTIIQKRQNGIIDFFRDWADYKKGFGNKKQEYWLGLDDIHAMTSQQNYTLRIELEDFDGNKKYANYNTFIVADESDNYRLTVGGYKGDAGDSLAFHNNGQFSTKDRDNDRYPSSCAEMFKGGWWYQGCHSSNLNGLYLGGPTNQVAVGVTWSAWLGQNYSLKKAVMKIRPRDF